MPGILSAIDEMDGDVRGLSFFAEELVGCVLDHVEFEDCTFESCSFSELQAQRLSFDRCTFDGCDFSNARLAKSYWRDCTLRESRLVGCDLHQSYWVRNTLKECACAYVNFAESKLEQMSFRAQSLVSEKMVLSKTKNQPYNLQTTTARHGSRAVII